MDVMRQVVRAEGGVIGLYKGLVPTLLREVPGCGAMFAAYEAIKLAAAQQQVTALYNQAICLHLLSMAVLRCTHHYSQLVMGTISQGCAGPSHRSS